MFDVAAELVGGAVGAVVEGVVKSRGIDEIPGMLADSSKNGRQRSASNAALAQNRNGKPLDAKSLQAKINKAKDAAPSPKSVTDYAKSTLELADKHGINGRAEARKHLASVVMDENVDFNTKKAALNAMHNLHGNDKKSMDKAHMQARDTHKQMLKSGQLSAKEKGEAMVCNTLSANERNGMIAKEKDSIKNNKTLSSDAKKNQLAEFEAGIKQSGRTRELSGKGAESSKNIKKLSVALKLISGLAQAAQGKGGQEQSSSTGSGLMAILRLIKKALDKALQEGHKNAGRAVGQSEKNIPSGPQAPRMPQSEKGRHQAGQTQIVTSRQQASMDVRVNVHQVSAQQQPQPQRPVNPAARLDKPFSQPQAVPQQQEPKAIEASKEPLAIKYTEEWHKENDKGADKSQAPGATLSEPFSQPEAPPKSPSNSISSQDPTAFSSSFDQKKDADKDKQAEPKADKDADRKPEPEKKAEKGEGEKYGQAGEQSRKIVGRASSLKSVEHGKNGASVSASAGRSSGMGKESASRAG